MAVQEIIIYRSPVEKALWDMTSNGDIIPIAVGCLAALIVFLVLQSLGSKMVRGWNYGRTGALAVYGTGLIAIFAGIFAANYMWL